MRCVTPITAPSSKESQNVTETLAGGFKPTSAHTSWGWAMMMRHPQLFQMRCSGRGCPTDIPVSSPWNSVFNRDISSFAKSQPPLVAFGVSATSPVHHGWAQAPSPTQMTPVVGPQLVEVLCGVLSWCGGAGEMGSVVGQPSMPGHGHPELAIPLEN